MKVGCLPKYNHTNQKFLVFPSKCLHRSDTIKNEPYFQLALKMDIWIEIITHPTGELPFSVSCTCDYCMGKDKNEILSIREDLREQLNYGIRDIILSYLDINNIIQIRNGCVCKCICSSDEYCSCSCTYCLDCYKRYHDNDYDYDYYDDNDYRDYGGYADECNGYE